MCEVNATAPGSFEGQELTRHILEEQPVFPEDTLKWAKKNFEAGLQDPAMRLVLSAVKNSRQDKKPAIIFALAAKICKENRLPAAAHSIYNLARKTFPDDSKFPDQQAKLYLAHSDPKAAIALLEALHEAGKGDIYTHARLGTAYLRDGNAKAAIDFLRRLHKQGDADLTLTNILGTAYIQDGNPDAAINLLAPLLEKGRGNLVTLHILNKADEARAGSAPPASPPSPSQT